MFKSSKVLVLFDFDGTLTKKDSFWEFLKFYRGKVKLSLGLFYNIIPILFYKIKVLSAEKAKEKLLIHFFRNESINQFEMKCRQFANEVIPQLIIPEAKQKLREYQKKKYRIIIVSASLENYLKPWCEAEKLELLATRLETDNSIYTGKILEKNCNGKEKELRLRNYLNLDEYVTIIAYGNSNGDKEMLALANQAFYKPF